MEKIPKNQTSPEQGVDLPKFGREYYLSIVQNYPNRLEQILESIGWSQEELFKYAEVVFTKAKFPNMNEEEKAAALLWHIENKAKDKFKNSSAKVERILRKISPSIADSLKDFRNRF